MSEPEPSLTKRVAKIGGVAVVVVSLFAGAIWFIQNRAAATKAEAANTEIKPPPPQPVSIMTAIRQPIQAWLFAEGTVRSVQREYLTFDRPGRVIYVRPGADGGDLREGERVKKGELLAKLDPRQYESDIDAAEAAVADARVQANATRAEIQQTVTQHELAKTQFERTRQLLAEKATSKAAFEEAEANVKNAEAARTAAETRVLALDSSITTAEARLLQAKLVLEETEILSPIDGIIAYLNIEKGFFFSQSSVRTGSESDALQSIPMVVIDPSGYEVTVNIPAFDSERIAVGQPVMLMSGNSTESTAVMSIADNDSAGARLNWTAQGEVFSVNPAVNPGGRSVQVRIRTTAGAERLRDGMFVTSWVEVQKREDAVVAPFNAFLYQENRPYVFVINEDNTAERRDIETGIQGLTAREIVSGVEAGERIAIDGRHRLVDGAEVRVVEELETRRLAGTLLELR